MAPEILPIELGDGVPCIHSQTAGQVVPGLCKGHKCVRDDKNDKLRLFEARLVVAKPAKWSEWGTGSLFQECIQFGYKHGQETPGEFVNCFESSRARAATSLHLICLSLVEQLSDVVQQLRRLLAVHGAVPQLQPPAALSRQGLP